MRAAFFVFVLQTACFAESVRGSGKEIHAKRDVPAFHGVDAGSGIHVRVALGPLKPVEVIADDNLVDLIETRVVDGILEVRFKKHSNIWNSGEVLVEAQTPTLDHAGASGGADVRVTSPVEGKRLVLEASGGGEVHAAGVNVEELDLSGSGGAGLDVSGKAGALRVEMSGGTHLKAAGLTARTMKVEGSGGCSGEVVVTEKVRGELSGGCDLRIHGAAQTRVATSGGSSIGYDDD